MGDQKKKLSIESLARANRNEETLTKLQQAKIEARDRLRAARAEMRRLDADLIGAGANGAELVFVCW